MRLLLDTHALLWALADSPKLSLIAAAAIADAANVKLVSAVSAYEVCLKHAIGKLPDAAALAADFVGVTGSLDVVPLPITLEHALTAGKLDLSHRDPFDRLLIAQAMVEGMTLVSNEVLFDRFGIDRIW